MTISVAQHAIAAALALFDVMVRGERIRVLLPVPFWRAVVVNTCGDALAAVTPARWGGEPIRFLGLQRGGVGGPAIIAAFATEVCVDAVLIAVIGVLLASVYAELGRAWLARFFQLATSPS
ncbi:MAG TPA: lysylphosphatidylglycerol synthase domain-containing protein, partial [Candidatus Dormibacteraeota bacterium]|nr:lysylphosphatidylglycerol synthase domain-containing protein [Candidatus Dormibacteraeota bacterium]